MSTTDLDVFLKEYTIALEGGYAALFAGAGLSRTVGFVDWKGLMRDIANELGLDVDQEDLIAVAQFHVNRYGGRHRLNQLLINEFMKDVQASINHTLIARLPIHTVWTTNYDTLIEDAFKDAHKSPDKKVTKNNLATTRPKSDVTVYKMHGDISQPDNAVLTKEDFETYELKRGLFIEQLKGDLIKKTFLFLGFSFTDPNIDYVLSKVRVLMGKNQRQHYCIMARPKPPSNRATKKERDLYAYNQTKLQLRVEDLTRYRIKAILIDDYTEIPQILAELNRRVHQKSIFVSGSAYEYKGFDQSRTEALAYEIGKRIIVEGNNIVSGIGLGIGGAVTLGAMEALYNDPNARIDDRAVLRPFPQGKPKGITRQELWRKNREDMIARSGFAIFISGNKKALRSNRAIIAGGVLEEFDIAKAQGKYPIPIGRTGYAAEQIWQDVFGSLKNYYPKGGVRDFFKVLNDPNSSNQQLIDAVFAIIKRVTQE